MSEISKPSSFRNIRRKRTEHERNALLYQQEIIPEIDYENSVFVLGSEKDNLNQILLYQKSLWQSDLAMQEEMKRSGCLLNLKQCTEELN